MRFLLAGCFVLASVFTAIAQGDDAERDKSWFNLHKLAIDIYEAENCVFRTINDTSDIERKRLQLLEARRTDVFVTAIDLYLTKYEPASRETAEGFKFRVWEIALRVGFEKARPMDASSCQKLIH